jgi:tetratricopeptide (TPR) repeat protein
VSFWEGRADEALVRTEQERAMTKKNGKATADNWLEQAYPEMHFLLLSLEGDEAALTWLKENSGGVSVLARAMTGRKKALAELHADEPVDLGDLFDLIDNDDLTTWLAERQPELHLMFEAIKGDTSATSKLKRARPGRAKLALVLRSLHEAHVLKVRNGAEENLDGGTAADMGCLIGEMHLTRRDYEKAVEAFTRAIETQAAADVYEGRARAYRGLAENDERQAAELRHKA